MKFIFVCSWENCDFVGEMEIEIYIIDKNVVYCFVFYRRVECVVLSFMNQCQTIEMLRIGFRWNGINMRNEWAMTERWKADVCYKVDKIRHPSHRSGSLPLCGFSISFYLSLFLSLSLTLIEVHSIHFVFKTFNWMCSSIRQQYRNAFYVNIYVR